MILGLDTKRALERMAKHYGVTNKNVLERLLLEAQSRLIEDMEDEQQTRYYGAKTLTTL